MPIYAYRCEACGHAKDVLQKISDPVLTDCPACGASAFRKQLTAAGFQLKGSGWYVTDFRGGSQGQGAATKPDAGSGEAPKADAPAPTTSAAPAPSPSPAPAPSPAASGSGSASGSQ